MTSLHRTALCLLATLLLAATAQAAPGDAEVEKGIHAYFKEENTAKAFKYFQAGVAKGNALAMAHLGQMYEHGETGKVDMNKALGLYLDAAEKQESQGFMQLAYFFNEGRPPIKKNWAVAWALVNTVPLREDYSTSLRDALEWQASDEEKNAGKALIARIRQEGVRPALRPYLPASVK